MKPITIPFAVLIWQNLTGIKGLSEAKVDKICEAAEKLVVSALPVLSSFCSISLSCTAFSDPFDLFFVRFHLSVAEHGVRHWKRSASQGTITSDLLENDWNCSSYVLILFKLIQRKSVVRITTGSQALDELLGGKIQAKAELLYHNRPIKIRRLLISIKMLNRLRSNRWNRDTFDHRGIWGISVRNLDAAIVFFCCFLSSSFVKDETKIDQFVQNRTDQVKPNWLILSAYPHR